MKVKLVLFASLREVLGEAELALELPAGRSVREFLTFLSETRGNNWSEVLQANQVLMAVNHELVDQNYVLQDGDEIAFFPPVTGG